MFLVLFWIIQTSHYSSFSTCTLYSVRITLGTWLMGRQQPPLTPSWIHPIKSLSKHPFSIANPFAEVQANAHRARPGSQKFRRKPKYPQANNSARFAIAIMLDQTQEEDMSSTSDKPNLTRFQQKKGESRQGSYKPRCTRKR